MPSFPRWSPSSLFAPAGFFKTPPPGRLTATNTQHLEPPKGFAEMICLKLAGLGQHAARSLGEVKVEALFHFGAPGNPSSWRVAWKLQGAS
eukprot:2625922-Alexandrium_andersonii.AAC.1